MYDDDDYDYKYVAKFVINGKDIFGSGDLDLSLSFSLSIPEVEVNILPPKK